MAIISHKAASVSAVPPMWPSWSSELARRPLFAFCLGHYPLPCRAAVVRRFSRVVGFFLLVGLLPLFSSPLTDEEILLKLPHPFYSVNGFVSRLGGWVSVADFAATMSM
jgi:hypothetical protein